MTDIMKLLSMPEGKTIEFKRDLSSIQPILKTLVAFANTAGGTLIIGQDDNGIILGINNVFESEEKLATAIADSIFPPLMPDIEITSIEGKSLLVVRVAHWWGPFYLKAKGPIEGVFIRLGSTNRAAGNELLDELNRSRTKVSFDQMPCLEIDIAGLDMERISQIFSHVGKKIDQNKLVNLGILVPYSKKLVCSNGGLILFGYKQLREQYFPNSIIKCARFLGTEKIEFLDRYDMEEWGTGYKRITQVCLEGSYPIPHWEEVGTTLKVTLYPYAPAKANLKLIVDSRLDELTKRQKEIAVLFNQKEKFTSKDILSLLGSTISERTLRADLLALKAKGFLKTIGKGPNTYWIIT